MTFSLLISLPSTNLRVEDTTDEFSKDSAGILIFLRKNGHALLLQLSG